MKDTQHQRLDDDSLYRIETRYAGLGTMEAMNSILHH